MQLPDVREGDDDDEYIEEDVRDGTAQVNCARFDAFSGCDGNVPSCADRVTVPDAKRHLSMKLAHSNKIYSFFELVLTMAIHHAITIPKAM